MTARELMRDWLTVRTAVGLAGMAISAALLAFAVPVVRGEYARLFVSDLETAVRARSDLSTAQLQDLSGVLKDAYAYRRDPAIALDLALIELLRLEKGAGGGDAVSYDRAAALLREGLAARPAAPHGWTRLARVRLRQGRDTQAVREGLVLAVTTGPVVRRLAVPRLEVGLRIWDGLTDYERGLVRRQARIAFEERPQATVRVALSAGRVGVVRGALTGLAARARFDGFVADMRG